MKKEGSLAKNTMVLVILTLILGTILGSVHYITEEPIRAQEQKTHDEALNAAMKEADSFETVNLKKNGLGSKIAQAVRSEGLTAEIIDEINAAKDSSGKECGYVFTVTTGEGYGGDIRFSLGIDQDGAITGLSYLEISETAGLGMRAKNASFVNQFVGKKSEKIKYSKSGASGDDEIDALSGSTVTTNAMVNGVNAALAGYRIVKEAM